MSPRQRMLKQLGEMQDAADALYRTVAYHAHHARRPDWRDLMTVVERRLEWVQGEVEGLINDVMS